MKTRALSCEGPAPSPHGVTGDTGIETGQHVMSEDSSLSLPELDDRIAILQANLRQLVEQAACVSGGTSEERTADRISQQSEDLERLTAQHADLSKK
jgi:uncharacterized small protein (DUF1192 family)